MQEYAKTIVEDHFNKRVISISQFPTGLSHFVFDVVLENGFPCVVRVARPERNSELSKGLFWQEQLGCLDVPLPLLLFSGIIDHHAYAVYERLPGSDLEVVYPSLSIQQKKSLAHQIAAIQQQIHLLDNQLFEPILPWFEVINSIIDRSEREILAKGVTNNPYICHIRNQSRIYQPDFDLGQSVAFLYDLNVRNVIVEEDTVTGIIDVDSVWFGDPLLAIGRGKTILMTMEADTDFISYWCEYLDLSRRQLELVDFYALLYCVRFMGTLGHKLNGNYSLQTDLNSASLLEKIADGLLEN